MYDITSLPLNPFACLCLLQAAIYLMAALSSNSPEHRALARCYVASAVIYLAFGVAHCLCKAA